MTKKYCNVCEHECHCVGKGYFIQSNQCGKCIGYKCECRPVILGTPVKKTWEQKIKDWLF